MTGTYLSAEITGACYTIDYYPSLKQLHLLVTYKQNSKIPPFKIQYLLLENLAKKSESPVIINKIVRKNIVNQHALEALSLDFPESDDVEDHWIGDFNKMKFFTSPNGLNTLDLIKKLSPHSNPFSLIEQVTKSPGPDVAITLKKELQVPSKYNLKLDYHHGVVRFESIDNSNIPSSQIQYLMLKRFAEEKESSFMIINEIILDSIGYDTKTALQIDFPEISYIPDQKSWTGDFQKMEFFKTPNGKNILDLIKKLSSNNDPYLLIDQIRLVAKPWSYPGDIEIYFNQGLKIESAAEGYIFDNLNKSDQKFQNELLFNPKELLDYIFFDPYAHSTDSYEIKYDRLLHNFIPYSYEQYRVRYNPASREIVLNYNHRGYFKTVLFQVQLQHFLLKRLAEKAGMPILVNKIRNQITPDLNNSDARAALRLDFSEINYMPGKDSWIGVCWKGDFQKMEYFKSHSGMSVLNLIKKINPNTDPFSLIDRVTMTTSCGYDIAIDLNQSLKLDNASDNLKE